MSRRAILAMGTVALVSGGGSAMAQVSSALERELIEMQIRYQQAFVDRDVDALRTYRAEEWTVVFPDGRQVARDEVERTFAGYRRELADVQEARVRFLSPDVALIEGVVRERFEVGGRLHDGLFRFTDVMVRRSRWQCVSSHFTLARNLLSGGTAT